MTKHKVSATPIFLPAERLIGEDNTMLHKNLTSEIGQILFKLGAIGTRIINRPARLSFDWEGMP